MIRSLIREAAGMTRLQGMTYLLLADFERVEDWCKQVALIFDGDDHFGPYLVGSATTRPDFRDVDLRVIFGDEVFDAEFGGRPQKVRTLNHAISTWGQRETGLPIDFQIQRSSEASAQFGRAYRNPMGFRDWATIPTSGVPALSPTEPAAGEREP